MSDYVQQNQIISDFQTSDSWVILSPIEASIKRKIEAIGTPLKDWNISINYGIKTGLNEAFIISTDKRNEILANCADDDERRRTEELIRPILRGRDIKRYRYDWANLWLINTHNGVPGKLKRIHIEDYPSVKHHLDEFYDELKRRADKGDTPYNLRNCAYMDDFNKPKIVWGNLNLRASYSFAPCGMYLNAPSNMIVTSKKSLLFFLNSTIADYYIRGLGVTRNGGYFEYKPMFIEQLPIPSEIDDEIFRKFEGREEELSDQIDSLIYQLFGLSPEEIAFINRTLTRT